MFEVHKQSFMDINLLFPYRKFNKLIIKVKKNRRIRRENKVLSRVEGQENFSSASKGGGCFPPLHTHTPSSE